jgi:acetyl-CoA acetyltransferase
MKKLVWLMTEVGIMEERQKAFVVLSTQKVAKAQKA